MIYNPSLTECRYLLSMFRREDRYGWKPSSSSNFPIRAFIVVCLIGSRQTVLYHSGTAKSWRGEDGGVLLL